MIRFMGEDGVDVPLWDDEGLMFGSPDELLEAFGPLGLSAALVSDVVTWARDWQTRSNTPGHDAEAARLIRQLKTELGGGLRIVYQP